MTDINKKEVLANTLSSGAYFGEIAILKKCKRTATVLSKSYTTVAEFHQDDFNVLCSRFPSIKQNMEKRIRKGYNDKCKRFIKHVVSSIDYFSYDIPDKILDEMAYMFEVITIEKDTFLFKKGSSCKEMYVITNGELDIYIGTYKQDTHLDTLYAGCIIGSYGILTCDDYRFSGKAKTNMTVLKLPYYKLQELRVGYEKLDIMLSDYEEYLDANGMPYCDYKLYRSSKHKLSPVAKLRNGIKRVISIVRSSHNSGFAKLLEQVKENTIKKQTIKEK